MADRERDWMWSEALQMLARADRLHRAVFRPAAGAPASWEPPIDVVETPGEVLIVAALPGVEPGAVEAELDGAVLVLAGRREAPARARRGRVHRLELPQGRFVRRIPLPPGRYDLVRLEGEHGCLTVSLRKAEGA
jgi:HSP20 family molecular chaperone IbpA